MSLQIPSCNRMRQGEGFKRISDSTPSALAVISAGCPCCGVESVAQCSCWTRPYNMERSRWRMQRLEFQKLDSNNVPSTDISLNAGGGGCEVEVLIRWRIANWTVASTGQLVIS